MITVHSLVYQPSQSEQTAPYHYNRVVTDCLNLIAGHGIEGDYKAGRNPRRHVNIMSLETLRELEREGWQVGPGQLGEQIVISGLDIATLPPGSQIRLGDSAVVEITKLRTGCEWLEQIQGKTPDDAAGRLGALGSVITSGSVCVGAPVVVIAKTSEQTGS
jgi:MOSC domain-containing protein YiiM